MAFLVSGCVAWIHSMQGFLLGSISNCLNATSKIKDVQPGSTHLLAVYVVHRTRTVDIETRH